MKITLPRIVVAGVLVLLSTVAFVILMFKVIHGPMTPTRLDRSVSGAAGRLSMPDCTPHPRDEQRWSCGVWIDEGRFSSSGVDYDVRVRKGSSCWTASLNAATAREAKVPARLDGCVRRWQIGL
jgi:hypothetical protein